MADQPMKLYAALDLSVGNKAATAIGDVMIVVERAFDFHHLQYYWFCSIIRDGNGGPMIFDSSWRLGDELQKHGINYMEDKMWIPLEWSNS